MKDGTRLGRYTILSPLGAGGMGEVYRARDEELERQVALKVLPGKLVDDAVAMARFRREALLLASINHPNIATLHGLEEVDGVRFLVLELVEGQSLQQRLRSGALPVVEAMRLTSQVAKALEAAHKRGVVHRDLKPANIMVNRDGWVKVLDFGVAKALAAGRDEPAPTVHELPSPEDENAGRDLTTAGTVVGTAPYMAPEQLRGEEVDLRADIWAFGCVLFETLSGRRAFYGGSTREIFRAVVKGAPPWEALPAELPPAVRTLLGRCLQKDPNRRLHSIADARIELDEALHPYLAPQQPPVSSPTASALPTGAGTGVGPGTGPLSASSPATLGYLAALGPYTVVERLGAGGMGEVYRAWDREGGHDVALKVLRPGALADGAARQGLQREAEALSALRHPHVAEAYGSGTSGELDYLAMEYVAGGSLAEKLQGGPLPEPEVARLGWQIASALAAAHRRGILHRDLKAGNVLLTPEGQAKLIDFGLAGLTRQRGPLPYLAPEVVAGDEPTEKSDLYSLGVLLYEMAVGERPFPEDNTQELTQAILHRSPGRLRARRAGLSPALEEVIERCLEKEPQARPASAAQVAELLQAEIPVTTVTRSQAVRRPARRRWWWAAAALAVVGVAAAAVMMLRPGGGSEGLPQVSSLVVMPSKVLGSETDAYLTDAIANSLSTHLAGLPDLVTKVPPTSLDVERVGGDLAKIADAYGVGALVLSTVSDQGATLVLNLQLVDSASRSLLWSREYQGPQDAYPELVRRAADGIRQALRPQAAALAPPSSTGGDDASEAELLMQQGLYYSNLYRNRARPGDKERAIEAFEAALEADPKRADAAAEIAVVHAASLSTGVSIFELLPQIRSWAERALEIDPRSSRAWAVLGEVEGGRTPESFRTKVDYALKAATFGPDDGYAQSRLAGPLALFSPTLALAAARRATEVDPLVLISPLFEALLLAGQGRCEEALERTDYALSIEPGMPFGLLTRAIVLSQDDEAEALRMVDEELQPLADNGQLPELWVELPRRAAAFNLASRSGDRQAADKAADQLIAMARGELPFPRWQGSTNRVPARLASFGRQEQALALLKFRAEHDILPPYEDLLLDPGLESVRHDDRFAPFLKQAREHFERNLALLEEARARGELPPYLEGPLAELLAKLRQARQEQTALRPAA